MRMMAAKTVVEYVVGVYGFEKAPDLLWGMSRHADWDSLVPAVFGVPAGEFEANWQAFLTARYGASPP